MKKTIIIDMDGTLTDVSERRHFVEGNNKNWEAFYSNMKNDKPRLAIIKKIENFITKLKIDTVFIVTSRRELARVETMEWLNQNVGDVILNKISHIYMRGDGDMRADMEVKKEIYNKEFKDTYEVVAVFEDRPRIIRMYQELGLNVIDCGDGKEF